MRVLPVPFTWKLEFDAFARSQYAFGVHQAAVAASRLGLEGISVLEFGVGAGRGLLALEEYASKTTRLTGIRISVVGFDRRDGLPRSTDYRDSPYIWSEGFFQMDELALRARLKHAQLILGDVSETVPAFVNAATLPPIGFIAFDLDYYSSTVHALQVLHCRSDQKLPRVYCYFDDTIGDCTELHSPFTGELLAISEFNQADASLKIAPINGLRHKRIIQRPWNQSMYVAHSFSHPSYNRPVGREVWQPRL